MTTGHGSYDDSAADGLKKKNLSKVSKNKSTPYEVDEDFTMSRFGKDGRKKSQLGDGNESIEEEESEIDEKVGSKEVDSPSDVKIEIPGLTTRQRALQGRGGHGESLIEFPDGLPAASSRSKFLVYLLSFFLLMFNIAASDIVIMASLIMLQSKRRSFQKWRYKPKKQKLHRGVRCKLRRQRRNNRFTSVLIYSFICFFCSVGWCNFTNSNCTG